MAGISYVFTISRVAEMLGEDEEWLDEISIQLDPEDGLSAFSASAKNRQPHLTNYQTAPAQTVMAAVRRTGLPAGRWVSLTDEDRMAAAAALG